MRTRPDSSRPRRGRAGGHDRRRPARREAAAPKPKTVAKHLARPLSAAVDDDGTAYVTQNFAGLLTRVRPGKKPKTIYASKGDEVGGVSVFHGKVVFTETASDAQGNPAKSWVKWIDPSGKVRTLANVRAYENRTNPDKKITYGVRGIRRSAPRLADRPVRRDLPRPADSHPYATLQTDEGTVFVADAGMNAVLAISPGPDPHGRGDPAGAGQDHGRARHRDGPACTVGKTYYGESVPTDVALRNGKSLRDHRGRRPRRADAARLGVRRRHQERPVKKLVGGLFAPVGIAVSRQRRHVRLAVRRRDLADQARHQEGPDLRERRTCRPRWSGPREAWRPSTCWWARPRRGRARPRAASWSSSAWPTRDGRAGPVNARGPRSALG